MSGSFIYIYIYSLYKYCVCIYIHTHTYTLHYIWCTSEMKNIDSIIVQKYVLYMLICFYCLYIHVFIYLIMHMHLNTKIINVFHLLICSCKIFKYMPSLLAYK